MSKSIYTYLYGPVPSHRLGRSLGIDLVPYKICNYDCIYCQLGSIGNTTVTLKEYADNISAQFTGKVERISEMSVSAAVKESSDRSSQDSLVAFALRRPCTVQSA